MISSTANGLGVAHIRFAGRKPLVFPGTLRLPTAAGVMYGAITGLPFIATKTIISLQPQTAACVMNPMPCPDHCKLRKHSACLP